MRMHRVVAQAPCRDPGNTMSSPLVWGVMWEKDVPRPEGPTITARMCPRCNETPPSPTHWQVTESG